MNIQGPKEPTVRIRGASYAYGHGDNRKQVLFDNDLDLHPGEIIIMTGPSGSGKTTLLTLVGALRKMQDGTINCMGKELSQLSPRELVDVRRGIGFVFQGHNLFESLTAAENVYLSIELGSCSGREREKRAADMLSKLGLEQRMDHKPQALSGGQKQRVAIARALVNHPRLILADEPTAALDKETGRQVVDFFRELASKEQATIMMVTHDNRILDVADRIVNMVDGRIVSNVAVRETVIICEFLKKCPLFSAHPAGTLAELAQRITRRSYQEGETVFKQGDVGDKFYVISAGSVAVQIFEDGRQKKSITLGVGDFFGEVALLTGASRNATVVCKEPAELLSLDKESFKDAVSRMKSLDEQLRDALSQRN